MTMKNILLAGIAIGAMAVAGSASALSLSGTTVGGVAVTGGTLAATTAIPYNIATEAKGPFTTPTAGTTATRIVAALQNGSLTSGQYLVQFNLGGATYTTASITGANLTLTGGTTASNATLQSSSASQVTFLVTIGGTDAITAFSFLAPFGLAAPGSVQAQAQVTLASNTNVVLDNGATPASNIIAARSGFAVTGTAAPQQATIASVFTLFTPASGNTSAVIGTLTTAPATTPGLTSSAAVYRDLIADATGAGDITGEAYTVSGAVGSTETITIAGSAASALGSTTVPSNTTGALTAATVTLTQAAATVAARAALAASTYSVAVTPTLATANYNAAAATGVTLGTVTYEGTAILAPWVGDGNNSYTSVVRIANNGAAIPGVTAVLRSPLGATTTSSACSLGGIAANSSTTVSSANLNACFGSFGNADVLFSVQAPASQISAKLRIINASTGVVTEQSLGSGNGLTFGTTNTGGAPVQN